MCVCVSLGRRLCVWLDNIYASSCRSIASCINPELLTFGLLLSFGFRFASRWFLSEGVKVTRGDLSGMRCDCGWQTRQSLRRVKIEKSVQYERYARFVNWNIAFLFLNVIILNFCHKKIFNYRQFQECGSRIQWKISVMVSRALALTNFFNKFIHDYSERRGAILFARKVQSYIYSSYIEYAQDFFCRS